MLMYKKNFYGNYQLIAEPGRFFCEEAFHLVSYIIDKKLKFPVVIKPLNEGSSVNVFICTKSNIIKNFKEKVIVHKKNLYSSIIEQYTF